MSYPSLNIIIWLQFPWSNRKDVLSKIDMLKMVIRSTAALQFKKKTKRYFSRNISRDFLSFLCFPMFQKKSLLKQYCCSVTGCSQQILKHLKFSNILKTVKEFLRRYFLKILSRFCKRLFAEHVLMANSVFRDCSQWKFQSLRNFLVTKKWY